LVSVLTESLAYGEQNICVLRKQEKLSIVVANGSVNGLKSLNKVVEEDATTISGLFGKGNTKAVTNFVWFAINIIGLMSLGLYCHPAFAGPEV
jgi:hypothetical protein